MAEVVAAAQPGKIVVSNICSPLPAAVSGPMSMPLPGFRS
jgi:hypothetical protein